MTLDLKDLKTGEATSGQPSSPTSINDLGKQIETITRKQGELDRKMEELNRDKISFITVSGIFLSVFTFISVEIQFLKYICDFYQVIGFTFILASLLMLFVISLDYLAAGWISDGTSNLVKFGNVIVFLCVVFALVGIMFVKKSHFGGCQNKTDATTTVQITNQK